MLEGLRERDHRLDADVPGLLLHRLDGGVALDVRIRLDPARGLNDLQRIGRGHQHLRQQRIRIQRDRRHQRLDLLGLERRRFGLCPYGAADDDGNRRQHHQQAPEVKIAPQSHE
jgi:hypothetical protein